jgi:hypothetical protein
LAVVSILLLLAAPPAQAQNQQPGPTSPPPEGPPGDIPGTGPPDESAVATPNLSFPTIHTTVVQFFYEQEEDGEEWIVSEPLTPLVVEEVMGDEWEGAYAICEEEWSPSLGIYVEVCVSCDPADGDDDCVEYPYPGVADYHASIFTDCEDDVADIIYDETNEYINKWLEPNEPWYPQPETVVEACQGDPNLIWDATCVEPANSWQAEWFYLDSDDFPDDPPVVYVDIVDWSDLLEAIPEWEVGTRVPISLTLYEYTPDAHYAPQNTNGSFIDDYEEYCNGGNHNDYYYWDNELEQCLPVTCDPDAMVAYKSSLIAFQGGPDEVFAVSSEQEDVYYDSPDCNGTGLPKYWEEVYFATVVTDLFDAEVCAPDASCQALRLDPTIEPDGKVNLKVAGYGFVPSMPGTHRIWVRFNDPLMTIRGAEVNDISNYVLETGCRAADLDWLKALRSGLAIDDTWLDFYVVEEHSGDPPPTPQPPSGGGDGGGDGGGNGGGNGGNP